LLAILSLGANPLPCPAGPYDPGDTGMPATCVGPPRYNSFYGACEVDARTPGSLAQLLERADSLMYEQKTRVRSELFASEQPGRRQAG